MLGPCRVPEDLPRLGGRRTSGRLRSERAQDPVKEKLLMLIMMLRGAEHTEQTEPTEHTNFLDYISELLFIVLIILFFFRNQLILPF
jgi:hypothetical protein